MLTWFWKRRRGPTLKYRMETAEEKIRNPKLVIPSPRTCYPSTRYPCTCCHCRRAARKPFKLSARAYQDFLAASRSDASLGDICYTASVRRSHHDYRLAVTGNSPEQLSAGLEAFLRGEARPGLSSGCCVSSRNRKLVFVFPGSRVPMVGDGTRAFWSRKRSFARSWNAATGQCDGTAIGLCSPSSGSPTRLGRG